MARGALHRVHRGVYALVPAGSLSRESRWLAALMAAGDGAVLSHLSAAALFEATRRPPVTIDVIVPRYRRSLDGVRIHECRRLDPRDVTTHRGIPVTTVARALVDLTDVQIAEELTNLIHEAAYRKRFSISAARDAMARANGRHNLAVLDEAIALWLQGSAGLKSRLEKAFLGLVLAAGLPKHLPNVHGAGIEVDAHWPGTSLVVELDGPHHTRPRTAREDALKQRILTDAGYTVLRFTELEIERRPAEVAETLYPRLKALKAERLVPSSSIRPDSTCLSSPRDSSS